MSIKYIQEPSKESVKNLFEDCLTHREQERLAHQLGYSIDTLFDKASVIDVERGVMLMLRGV